MIAAILTLAQKDMRLLFRDRFAMFWIFAFPLMYALFFGALFADQGDGGGGRARMAIAIVDDDGGAPARALVDRLAQHRSLQVEREGDMDDGKVALSTLPAAAAAVQKGRRVAYVHIQKGWQLSPFAMFGAGRGGGDADTPRLRVGIDPARAAEAGMLQGVLMESVFAGLAATFTDKAAMRAEIERSLAEARAAAAMPAAQKLILSTFLSALDRFFADADITSAPATGGDSDLFAAQIEVHKVEREQTARPRSSHEITFPQSMIWGLMGVAIGFAITLVRERTTGTMLRLCTAPISRAQLLAGKALGCFLTCCLVLGFMVAFGAAVLSVRVGNVWLLALAITSTATCFTGVMMVAAVCGRTEQAVAGASWGLMMPFAMIGGGMIPLIAMPAWLLQLSSISPFKWGIMAVEGAIWRGFSAADMALPCTVLLAIGGVLFWLGVAIFRRMRH